MPPIPIYTYHNIILTSDSVSGIYTDLLTFLATFKYYRCCVLFSMDVMDRHPVAKPAIMHASELLASLIIPEWPISVLLCCEQSMTVRNFSCSLELSSQQITQ